MTQLSPARRRELRAAAHHLNPVVSVAGNGLSPSVVAEIDRALGIHALVKVRVYGEDRAARTTLMDAICQQVMAQPVQHIGNILVLWREKPEEVEPSTPPLARTRPAPRTTASTESFARRARAKALAPSTSRSGARRSMGSTATRAPQKRTRSPQR